MLDEEVKEPMEFHLLEAEKVLQRLHTSKDGLTTEETKRRAQEFGSNTITETKRVPNWLRFLRQFQDPLIIILLIAAAIMFILEPGEIDWIVIFIIVNINAVIGYVQEWKSEEAIERLKSLSAPKAIVVSGGRKGEIFASRLVPGDIIYLETGMRVPADARIIECTALRVNEASLTGESIPDEKFERKLEGDVPLAERGNMLYMGTLVETGKALAVVTAIGMRTEVGKIADMIQNVEASVSPLQKRLKKLGKALGIFIISTCTLIFLLQVWRELPDVSFMEVLRPFETSVALAVAGIPEGLPAVVTIVLAIGLRTMAMRNVIIRKLPVVETLGSATVICTDKTGTLTTGSMTADLLYADGRKVEVTGSGYRPVGDFTVNGEKVDPDGLGEAFQHIMKAAILCSDASLVKEEKIWKVLGDTTEGALIVMARKSGLDPADLRTECGRMGELPFDAERKMMTTTCRVGSGSISYTKGAPESVLSVSAMEMIGGRKVPMTGERKMQFLSKTERLAGSGYRVLGFAFHEEGAMERDMTFLGIVGIRDKIRPEAKQAVRTARMAGIRPIMITGDHKLTASAIGREIGLIRSEAEAMNCRDLDSLNDQELTTTLRKVSVFARASPEHKVRIVKGLKEMGEIVAMTGDGVNDAPALKMAHIGVAMGITGTDVAKEASDMVITDDNFASIVSAVEEGRYIYDNIRKVIQYLLSCNMGEVFFMLVAVLIGWPLPLVALMLLWMNLAAETFPALALAVEPREPDIMKHRPRDPNESALTKDMLVSIAVSAGIITIGTMMVFWYNYFFLEHSIGLARTIAMTTMIFFQMWTAVATRSTTHTMAEIGWFSNKKLIYAIAFAIGILTPIIYIPFLQSAFGTEGLGVLEWAQVIVISVFGLIAVELWERANRKFFHFGAAGR